MTKRRRAIAAALLLVVAACGRSSDRAAVEQKSASAGTVTLSMENSPAPPVTGANTLTIVVRNGDGTPVTDAMVSGELFMPVMESMGKTTISFVPAGNGRYTGQGTLSMAGAWQIAVTATRGGRQVATRTFNLTTKS
jgi:nitrogen fixation protein FixH